MHRLNPDVPNSNIEACYRKTIYLSFLDTIIQQQHLHFTEQKKAAGLFLLTSSPSALNLPLEEAEAIVSRLWQAYYQALQAKNFDWQDAIGL